MFESLVKKYFHQKTDIGINLAREGPNFRGMVFELNKAKVWGLSAGLSSRPDSRTRYWFLLQQLAPRETSHRSLAMFSIRGRRKGVVPHTLPTVDQRSHLRSIDANKSC